ncbi:MAG: penicillin-binding protein 2 [Lautropia sp.]
MSRSTSRTEVRNPEAELARLRLRLWTAMLLVVACFGILVARFWYLQVTRYETFHAQAEDNRITVLPVAPQRGNIVDRNGRVLAENVFSYALEISPARVGDLDETIARLSKVIDISASDRRRFRRMLGDKKFTDTLPLKTRLTDEEVARIASVLFRFDGVEVKARPYRSYPLGKTAAHVIGHIGRITADEVERIEKAGRSSAYAGSTHMGKLGVEVSYEDTLHGEPGMEEMEVAASGKAVRALSRVGAKSGNNLWLTLDARLQRLIEEWYGDRKGALVAIEPSSGEILAMVSMPTFDPNLFVDGIDVANWNALNNDPDRPLLNRPLRGTYPPGSTYKPFMALAVMKTGVRRPTDAISDPGYFQLGNHRFRDSKPTGNGRVDLYKSIVVSSDTYFYGAAYEMGVDRIHDFMQPWGFGRLTGIDLKDEATGILPSSEWKKKRFKQQWYPGETPSIGIGQGYNSFTMLQLAHATATLANDGVVMVPHLMRAVEDPVTRTRTPVVTRPADRIELSPESLKLVKNAMVAVNTHGTGRIAFAGAEYVAAGKTGTAQVIGIKQNEKYDAKKIAEKHRDHSLFVAFAPVDKPRIALALIVENAGFGAAAAAPIARKVFDYYLLGKLPKDQADPFAPSPAEEEEMRDVPDSTEPELVPDGIAEANAALPAAGRRPGAVR